MNHIHSSEKLEILFEEAHKDFENRFRRFGDLASETTWDECEALHILLDGLIQARHFLKHSA